MKICVIGAGAMGSAYGGLLARAGHEVTLVDTWVEHIAAIRAKGLRLDGVMGNLEIRLHAETAVPAGLGAELAMIWTDSNHTREAAESARAALGFDGFAITMQNGIGNVETLVEVLGKKRVAGGSSMASAAMRGPGHAALTHMGKTSIGELDGAASARIERLREALAGAGFEVRVHPGIMSAMDRLQDRVIDEVLAVTAAKKVTLDDPDLRATVKAHCWKRFSRPSMLQHIEAGRRTEIGALNARLVEEGARLGVATPYNDAVACLLRGVEHKRCEAAGRTEADYAALEAQAGARPGR